MQKSKTLPLTHQGISEDSAKDIKKAAKGAAISFLAMSNELYELVCYELF